MVHQDRSLTKSKSLFAVEIMRCSQAEDLTQSFVKVAFCRLVNFNVILFVSQQGAAVNLYLTPCSLVHAVRGVSHAMTYTAAGLYMYISV